MSAPIDWLALRDAAEAVRANAYAPYSRYLVGAALLAEDGRVFLGCNVENASYGLSVCAERHAVARAVSEGVRHFAGLVVVTRGPIVAAPCGVCRQVLNEFPPSFPVHCFAGTSEPIVTDVASLLPHPFGPGDLEP